MQRLSPRSRKTFGLFVLSVLLIGDPGVGFAQSGVDWTVKTGAAWLRRPITGFSVTIIDAVRVYSVTLPAADHGRLTTTLDYHVMSSGPIGSLGFQPSLANLGVDPIYLNPATTIRPAEPEVTIGARLSYRFR